VRTEGKTVVVSSRLPLTIEPENTTPPHLRPGNGGLARTLDSIMWDSGGIWVGCAPKENMVALTVEGDRHGYSTAGVCLESKERIDHEGFSNDAIWPLFHCLKSQCRLDPDRWSGYCKVNGKIAEAVQLVARPEDCVWVHDYPLMMVASLLRANGSHHRIGYTQHIPFPPSAILKSLPWRVELLQALLQFDLISFQSEEDRHNFLASLAAFLPPAHRMELGGETIIRVLDREARIATYPVGIDFDEFSVEGSDPNIIAASRAIQKQLSGAKIVLAVNRLDSSAGMFERIRAFQRLLELFPEMTGKVTMIQIVIPRNGTPSENNRADLQIEAAAGQINRRFGSSTWRPIHYYYRCLTQAQLIAFYRAANVALITPLRGGMNLVAKEFCACRNDDKGVLLLSELYGAAEELKFGALLVDPYNVDHVASVLYVALRMSESEQKERMTALRNHIRIHDIFDWSNAFQSDFVRSKGSRQIRRMPQESSSGHSREFAAE
jgi:trehalose 6-phosphate synthase